MLVQERCKRKEKLIQNFVEEAACFASFASGMPQELVQRRKAQGIENKMLLYSLSSSLLKKDLRVFNQRHCQSILVSQDKYSPKACLHLKTNLLTLLFPDEIEI